MRGCDYVSQWCHHPLKYCSVIKTCTCVCVKMYRVPCLRCVPSLWRCAPLSSKCNSSWCVMTRLGNSAIASCPHPSPDICWAHFSSANCRGACKTVQTQRAEHLHRQSLTLACLWLGSPSSDLIERKTPSTNYAQLEASSKFTCCVSASPVICPLAELH